MRTFHCLLAACAILGHAVAQPVCSSFHDAGGAAQDMLRGLCVDGDGATYLTGSFSDTLAIGGQLITVPGLHCFVAKVDASDMLAWHVLFSTDPWSMSVAMAWNGTDGVVIAGDYMNDLSFGSCTVSHPGGFDIFLVELNTATGQCNWLQHGSSIGHAHVRDMAIDPDGGVRLVGGFWGYCTFGPTTLNCTGTSSPFVAAYDADGNGLWARQVVDATGGSYTSVDVDPSGNTFGVGQYASTAYFGNGIALSGGGSFIARYDIAGVPQWARQNWLGAGSFKGVGCDSHGDAYVLCETPTTLLKVDAVGDTVWTTNWDGIGYTPLNMAPPFGVKDDRIWLAAVYTTDLEVDGTVITSTSTSRKPAFVAFDTTGAVTSMTGFENNGLSDLTPTALDFDPAGRPVCGGYFTCTSAAPDTLLDLVCSGTGDLFYTRACDFAGVEDVTVTTDAPVIFPVPFHDVLHVQLPAGVSPCAEHLLMDMTGRVVHSGRSCGSTFELTFTDAFSRGMYLLQITTEGGAHRPLRLVRE